MRLTMAPLGRLALRTSGSSSLLAAGLSTWIDARNTVSPRPHASFPSASSAARPGTSIRQWPYASIQRSIASSAVLPGSVGATSRVVDGEDTSSIIYEEPLLYDAAFSYRNYQDEVKFLIDAYRTHGGGKPLTSVVELGCGPAHHAIGLAQSGVPKVLALDINRHMLKYAAAKAAAAGGTACNVSFAEGDMCEFQLPAAAHPADLVICLLGTFSHMLDNAQAIRCLNAVTRALRPGGLFILELAHPGDLFDGTFTIGDGSKEMWEVPIDPQTLQPTGSPGSDGRVQLLVEWGAEFDSLDPVSQEMIVLKTLSDKVKIPVGVGAVGPVLIRTVTMSVLEGGEVLRSLAATIPQRMFTAQELALLAQATGSEVIAMYGEMQMSVDLGHEDAYRLVAVLQKNA